MIGNTIKLMPSARLTLGKDNVSMSFWDIARLFGVIIRTTHMSNTVANTIDPRLALRLRYQHSVFGSATFYIHHFGICSLEEAALKYCHVDMVHSIRTLHERESR